MFSFVVFHCVHVSMALAIAIVLFGAGYLCCVILWHLWLSFLNRVVLCERSLDMYHENIRATWGVVRCKLLCSSVFVLWCAIFVLCCVLWHLWLSFLCCVVFVLSHLWLSPRLLCCAYMHICEQCVVLCCDVFVCCVAAIVVFVLWHLWLPPYCCVVGVYILELITFVTIIAN